MKSSTFAALASLVLVACSRTAGPTAEGADGGTVTSRLDGAAPGASVSASAASASGPAKRHSRKPGEDCTDDWDCESPDGCNVSCTAAYDDKNHQVGAKYCQLKTIAEKEGAGPCVGNVSVSGGGSHAKAKTPRAVLCNVDAGVYCDQGSNVCAKAKAAGEACLQAKLTGWHDDDECGRDGACENEKCIAAGEAGASCKKTRCKSSARCDRKTSVCIARKPAGAKCRDMDECLSFDCLNQEKCVEPAAKAKCAL
jgi:hypothetical protein